MKRQLTPIDRGEVYEPKPWGLIDPVTNAVDHDRCGRVDFDNHESATLFVTRLVERSPQARDLDDLRPTLEVESLADVRLTINLDGDDVFTHVPAHLKDVTMPLHDRLDDADVLRFGREVIAALVGRGWDTDLFHHLTETFARITGEVLADPAKEY